jgi:HEAT repeat protein
MPGILKRHYAIVAVSHIAESISAFQDYARDTVARSPQDSRVGLVRLGDVAVPQLIQALDDPDPYIWFSASLTLADIGPPAAAVPRVLEILTSAITSAIDDFGPSNQAIAARCLGWVGDPAAPAVPALVRLLEPESRASSDAHRALVQIGEVAIPTLLSVVVSDENARRNAALSVLGQMTRRESILQVESQPPETVAVLLRIFAETDPQDVSHYWIRRDAVDCLVSIAKMEDVVPALARVIGEGDPFNSVGEAFSRLGSKALPAVLDWTSWDPKRASPASSPCVRWARSRTTRQAPARRPRRCLQM